MGFFSLQGGGKRRRNKDSAIARGLIRLETGKQTRRRGETERRQELVLLRARGRNRAIDKSVKIAHKEEVYQENRTGLLNTSSRRYKQKFSSSLGPLRIYLIVTPQDMSPAPLATRAQTCRCKIRTVTLAHPLPHLHRHTRSYSDATGRARQHQRRDRDQYLLHPLATYLRS